MIILALMKPYIANKNLFYIDCYFYIDLAYQKYKSFFIKFFLTKFIIILLFLKSIIFDLGYFNLKILPYFIFRIFDFSLVAKYYPELNFSSNNNKLLFEYKKMLYCGYSKYKFMSSIYLDFPWLIQPNWLIIDIKYGESFFDIVRLYKPKFIK